jgi:hypothetical protein
MPPKQPQQQQPTSDDKLDLILQKISAMEVRQEKLEQLVTKVTQLENQVAEQKCVIATMQTEIKHLKEMANVQDQATRGDTLRLFNVPGSNDEVGLPNKVYENILKPILAAAKNSGEIQTLPHLNTICTTIFRAGKFAAGSDKPPPPGHYQVFFPAGQDGHPQEQEDEHPPGPRRGQEVHHSRRLDQDNLQEAAGVPAGREDQQGLDHQRRDLGPPRRRQHEAQEGQLCLRQC